MNGIVQRPPAMGGQSGGGFLQGAQGGMDAHVQRKNMPGGYSIRSQIPGNMIRAFRSQVNSLSLDLVNNHSLVKYGMELAISYMLGSNGLSLTVQLDAKRLGITDDQAEAIAEQMENIWIQWANCTTSDQQNTETFHQQVETALRRWWTTGEILFRFPWGDVGSAGLRTRAKAFDPGRIWPQGQKIPQNANVIDGIEFDPNGNPTAVYILPRARQVGSSNVEMWQFGSPERSPFQTLWGRPITVLAIGDRAAPGVFRGMSPIAAAIASAIAGDHLSDVTLRQLAAQASIVFALESPLDPEEAKRTFFPDDQPIDRLAAIADHLMSSPLQFTPETVSIVPTGSKLTAVQGQQPTTGYDIFTRRLLQELARGLGLDYAELTGDFSQTNFSASRMAQNGPWAIITRRRHSLIEPLYQAAFKCVMEEAFSRNMIELPDNAPSFYDAEHLWLNATFAGPTKPTIDPVKEANANSVELSNGTTSLTEIAARNGTDWRQTLKNRSREEAFAKKLNVSLGHVVASDDEADEAEDPADKPMKKGMK